MTDFLFWFNILSGFCSISGYTFLGVFRLLSSKAKYMKAAVIKPYILTATALFVISLTLTYKPWNKFHYGDGKPKTVHDTVKIKVPIAMSVNANRINKPQSTIIKGHHIVPSVGTILLSEKKPKTDTVFKAKNLVNAPNYGNQQVGDNNVQNNIGKLDHHPDLTDINTMMRYLTNKSRKIVLMYETPDSDSKNYCDELKSILEKNGYQQVELFGHLNIGLPPQPKKVLIDTANYRISVEWDYN